MRFALLSADPTHRKRFWINGEQGDCTSFMNWVHVWKGHHFCYAKVNDEDMAYFRTCDVVMMSGHPNHMADISRISKALKDSEAVTMFYPEGSTQLYDNSIRGFHREYYDAWNACDILSAVEEDKISYYESFITSETIVRFIHVPLRQEMEEGRFLIPRQHKQNAIAVYGDNNPNHPMIAIVCARKLGLDVLAVEIDIPQIKQIAEILPGVKYFQTTKVGQFPFLRLLGRTVTHIYPTEWIGTARQQIACALVGTPCIGSRDSHTQQRLWPNVMARIYDVEDMTCIARELMSNDSFYSDISKRAFNEAVSFYGHDSTCRRFVSALEDAKRLKNRAQIPAGA